MGELSWGEKFIVRFGGRAGLARAKASADPASGTQGLDRTWPLMAAVVGAEFRALPWLSLLGNIDRSVRAPNLDDLTSRQQTGPGFQFENPGLGPEVGTTGEGGLRMQGAHVSLEGWAYRAVLDHAMTRGLRTASDCPPDTLQCTNSRYRIQLINVAGVSIIDGAELWARVRWPGVGAFSATLAHARGEGPSPSAPNDPNAPREPLSRIPPLNGTLDARIGASNGPFAGAGLRWAAAQQRLSTTDYADARIPRYGTPGFAVLDARCGYRVQRDLVVAVVFENVTNAAYRYHGSAINGPGRGVILSVEAGL
jgi:iron complex outermembrane receptor protein/hemoglobin/transferrin/lactoferrin receptor protein